MVESRIRVLDEATANQIAAGEVVERPASVVKELLENALDAGAQRIRLEIEEGGTRRIRIVDDGHGMPPEDARLCLQRHATSKLRTAADLTRVRTMGFRGEAIPSIASVSRFTLTTRSPGYEEGVELYVEGGHLKKETAVGAALGTVIDVEDLFFNVPARKKFLKRPSTELGHISDMVNRLALAHPAIAFRLKHGAKTLIDVPPAAPEDPLGRIARVLGRKVADALHPIEPGPDRPVKVTGYAADPALNERTTRGQYVFVNGRFIRDRTVQHAIQDGYRTLMEKGRHPVVILMLEVDPSSFDVNVHPQKTEVRFAETQGIHRAVTGALRRTLLAQPWLQSGQYAVAVARSAHSAAFVRDGNDKGLSAFVGLPDIPSPSDAPRTPARSHEDPSTFPKTAPRGPRAHAEAWRARVDAASSGRAPSRDASHASPVPSDEFHENRRAGSAEAHKDAPSRESRKLPPEAHALPPAEPSDLLTGIRPAGRFSQLEPVGQVLGTYLVCQGPEEMVLIDQHAAHERIAFQQMRAQRDRSNVMSQPLLMPIPLELSELRAQTANTFADRLNELGFEIAPFGGRTWLVKATPVALTGAHIEQLVLDMLDELATVEQTTPFDEYVDALLSCAACHSVVRAGDRLEREEVRALLRQMDNIDFGAHCPHGRPVFVSWSGGDLAKLFHRT
ncbi:MAG: DNA mismatch repair endonuclease MutL [Myxococcota bacterium]